MRIQCWFVPLSWLVATAIGVAQETTCASVAQSGVPSAMASFAPSISGDGRLVAFQSLSADLVANDTNAKEDIFVHDRVTQTTVRANVATNGSQSAFSAQRAKMSRNGRFVAFDSYAADLDPIKTQTALGVFVRDLVASTTEVVSIGTSGQSSAGYCNLLDISADGNFVLFWSYAPDLVPGDSSTSHDLFVRDRAAGTTTSFTVGNGGMYDSPYSLLDASISDDGRFVAYIHGGNKAATLHDRWLGTSTLVAKTPAGLPAKCAAAIVSGDGTVVAFQTDIGLGPQDPANFVDDVYVYTVATGALELVSRNTAGVAGNKDSGNPSLSADGRFVFFTSFANDIVLDDTNNRGDGFVRDRLTQKTMRVSVGDAGQQGDGSMDYGEIRADGLEVAFENWSTNLVPVDSNGVMDVFVRALTSPATVTTYGVGVPGTGGAVPALTLSAAPKLGATPTLFIGNSAGVPTLAALALGFAPANLTTTPIGPLLVDPLLFVFVPVPVGGASLPVAVPDDPTICGPSEFLQAIEQDAGAAAGLTFSAGLEIHPGS